MPDLELTVFNNTELIDCRVSGRPERRGTAHKGGPVSVAGAAGGSHRNCPERTAGRGDQAS